MLTHSYFSTQFTAISTKNCILKNVQSCFYDSFLQIKSLFQLVIAIQGIDNEITLHLKE